jgi:CheY-like chemotaxis protein
MGKAVLVVEDDPGIRDAIVEFLTLEGYLAWSSVNGREALDRLAAEPALPRVILLDLMMPVMDGFKFREAQAKDPRLAQVPVIVMSADSQLDAHRSVLGAADYLRKPLDIERLAEVLKRY